MKRKLMTIITLFALLICFNATPLLVHAEEESLLRSTTFVAEIDTNSLSTIYVGDSPTLLSRTITLTSNSLNPEVIIVRVVNFDATILLNDTPLAPGGSVTFTVPPNLGDGEFNILAVANSVAGAYSFNINQGDGPNLITTNLTTDNWTTLSSSSIPLFLNRIVTITNHIDSPDAIDIRIIGSNGILIYNYTNIAPGASRNATIAPEFPANSYIIQAKATNIDGLYFITVED